MANRIIRDWTTSEKIDSLSEGAELFFVRLIMKADDHGCFHANKKLLKAALFPLKDYDEYQIQMWLSELASVGIVVLYTHEGREYLKINDFGQRLRNMVSKFPQPAANPPLNVSNPPPETKRREVEVEEETEYEKKDEILEIGDPSDLFVTISKKYVTDSFTKIYDLKQWFGKTEQLSAMIKSGFTDFSGFMKAKPAAMFSDSNHLYNSFIQFHEKKPVKKNPGKLQ